MAIIASNFKTNHTRKSTALFIQGIGRGLRISPKTGKVDCLYLDLVGNINEHFGHTLNLDKPRVQ